MLLNENSSNLSDIALTVGDWLMAKSNEFARFMLFAWVLDSLSTTTQLLIININRRCCRPAIVLAFFFYIIVYVLSFYHHYYILLLKRERIQQTCIKKIMMSFVSMNGSAINSSIVNVRVPITIVTLQLRKSMAHSEFYLDVHYMYT